MVKVLKDRSNQTIMDAIRSDAPLSYQQRIPLATQAGVKVVAENLFSHRPFLNEFVDSLVNRIGSVIGQGMIWTNPLAQFKQGMLAFGDTVEEYQVGLVKAHSYDPDRDYMERVLFGQETPQVKSIFHTLNRQDMYKITINERILKRAFLETDGLSSFLSDLMVAPVTSDNVDEFKLICRLIPQYEENGGFYKVNIPDIADSNSTEAQARTVLRSLRSMAGTLQFVSTLYNAAGMPTFASRDKLVLITTPQFLSAIDVNALAAAFNIEKAEFVTRTILIPQEEFGIPGAQAILTTFDFFRIYDNRIENTSQPNPAGLYNNYFLHHWSIISNSLFVPAILYTTEAGTVDDKIVIVPPVSLTVSVVDSLSPFLPGGIYAVEVTATPAGSDAAVVWSISGNNSSKTFITQEGNVHVGSDETSTSLTITATAVFDGSVTDGESATVTPGVIRWPIASTAKPIISGVGPASAKATELVTITGHFFNDATSVKFGATEATNFAVVADNKIIATVPAGSAGSVNVTVTNPIGASDNFAYTRGA